MKYELSTTEIFDGWFQKLDRTTQNKLLARFVRIENGNLGDHKAIENNLFELRCFFDGGISIYYTIRNHRVILLLSGGNKSSQTRDIEKSRIILEMLGD
ncbi:MAG: type II toxin-antitoxin system RelE/ParE family toxin [Nitrosomonas sp.]|nr:type II toxin-antitoxin system RelE/ParE family toxin [Nitrosomonas sp.]